ncbi:unnamed protein product [Closterium sp. NIES-65]|nr:unnamed protein product [Closterium sp. NIES-65]
MLISARHADGFQPTAEIAEENRATKAAAAWHAAITRRRASLGGNVGADPRRRSGSFKANSINGAGSIASSCGSSFGSSSMSRSGSTLTSRSSSSSLARSDSVGFGPSRFVLRQRYEDIRLRYLVHKEQLGTGEYGAVRPCVEADSGRLLACKTIRKQQITTYEDAEAIRTEVACLWEVRGHPSIISLHDAVEDGKRVHLVMELCHGGDLFRRVTQRGTLSERSAAKVCHALATAVLHCHRHGIMHRDIKPKNVLLLDDSDEPHVKLSDFGVATFFEDGDSLTEFAGTTQYIAPEVWKGQYGPEADIWGLGALLYFCIADRCSYGAPSERNNMTVTDRSSPCKKLSRCLTDDDMSFADDHVQVDSSRPLESSSATRDPLEGGQRTQPVRHDDVSVSVSASRDVSRANAASSDVPGIVQPSRTLPASHDRSQGPSTTSSQPNQRNLQSPMLRKEEPRELQRQWDSLGANATDRACDSVDAEPSNAEAARRRRELRLRVDSEGSEDDADDLRSRRSDRLVPAYSKRQGHHGACSMRAGGKLKWGEDFWRGKPAEEAIPRGFTFKGYLAQPMAAHAVAAPSDPPSEREAAQARPFNVQVQVFRRVVNVMRRVRIPVIHPYSRFRRDVNLLIALCITYNVSFPRPFNLPSPSCLPEPPHTASSPPLFFPPVHGGAQWEVFYQVAFNLRAQGAWQIVDACLSAIFLADVFLGFKTGYVTKEKHVVMDDGMKVLKPQQIVMDQRKVVWHYLRTWFALDLLSSLPFDLLTSLASDSPAGFWISVAFRLLKLFRVHRLGVAAKQLRRASVNTNYMDVAILLFQVPTPHALALPGACIFVLIGRLELPDETWLGATYWSEGGVAQTLESAPAGVVYVAAIYCQVGYGDIHPMNTLAERLFATVYILLTAIMLGYTIGELSSMVYARRMQRESMRQRMTTLHRFIEREHLPEWLANRMVCSPALHPRPLMPLPFPCLRRSNAFFKLLHLPPHASSTPCLFHPMPLPPHASSTPCLFHPMPLPPHASSTPCLFHPMPLPPHASSTPCLFHPMPLPPHASSTPCLFAPHASSLPMPLRSPCLFAPHASSLPMPLRSPCLFAPHASSLPMPLRSPCLFAPHASSLPMPLCSPCLFAPHASSLPMPLRSPCLFAPHASSLPMPLRSPCLFAPHASSLPMPLPSPCFAHPMPLPSSCLAHPMPLQMAYLMRQWQASVNSKFEELELMQSLTDDLRTDLFVHWWTQHVPPRSAPSAAAMPLAPPASPFFPHEQQCLATLQRVLVPRAVAAGDVVVREGEVSRHVYVVRAGTLEMAWALHGADTLVETAATLPGKPILGSEGMKLARAVSMRRCRARSMQRQASCSSHGSPMAPPLHPAPATAALHMPTPMHDLHGKNSTNSIGDACNMHGGDASPAPGACEVQHGESPAMVGCSRRTRVYDSSLCTIASSSLMHSDSCGSGDGFPLPGDAIEPLREDAEDGCGEGAGHRGASGVVPRVHSTAASHESYGSVRHNSHLLGQAAFESRTVGVGHVMGLDGLSEVLELQTSEPSWPEQRVPFLFMEGTFQAKTECELLLLLIDDLFDTLESFPELLTVLRLSLGLPLTEQEQLHTNRAPGRRSNRPWRTSSHRIVEHDAATANHAAQRRQSRLDFQTELGSPAERREKSESLNQRMIEGRGDAMDHSSEPRLDTSGSCSPPSSLDVLPVSSLPASALSVSPFDVLQLPVPDDGERPDVDGTSRSGVAGARGGAEGEPLPGGKPLFGQRRLRSRLWRSTKELREEDPGDDVALSFAFDTPPAAAPLKARSPFQWVMKSASGVFAPGGGDDGSSSSGSSSDSGGSIRRTPGKEGAARVALEEYMNVPMQLRPGRSGESEPPDAEQMGARRWWRGGPCVVAFKAALAAAMRVRIPIVHPYSRFRRDVNLIVGACIAYNLVSQPLPLLPVPRIACLLPVRSPVRPTHGSFTCGACWEVLYMVAFDLRATGAWLFLDSCLSLVYLADVLLGFKTGYLTREKHVMGEGGVKMLLPQQIVMDQRRIVWHYLRTWFVVDVLSSLPIDLIISALAQSSIGFWLSAALRLLKLLRLRRLGQATQQLRQSALAGLYMEMTILVLQICMVCHVGACAFALIGRLETAPQSWLAAFNWSNGGAQETLESAPHGVVYAAAYYWAMVTFASVGYGDIHPVDTLAERLFATGYILVTSILLGYAIGQISSLIYSSRARRESVRQRCNTLHRFIEKEEIPEWLANRMMVSLTGKWQSELSQRFHEGDLVDALSDDLRADLFVHWWQRHVLPSPMLPHNHSFLAHVFPCLILRRVAPADVIASEGEFTRHLYIVRSGTLDVTRLKDGPPPALAPTHAVAELAGCEADVDGCGVEMKGGIEEVQLPPEAVPAVAGAVGYEKESVGEGHVAGMEGLKVALEMRKGEEEWSSQRVSVICMAASFQAKTECEVYLLLLDDLFDALESFPELLTAMRTALGLPLAPDEYLARPRLMASHRSFKGLQRNKSQTRPTPFSADSSSNKTLSFGKGRVMRVGSSSMLKSFKG